LKETETWTVVCEKHSVVILHYCSNGFWTEKCVILTYEHEIDPDEWKPGIDSHGDHLKVLKMVEIKITVQEGLLSMNGLMRRVWMQQTHESLIESFIDTGSRKIKF